MMSCFVLKSVLLAVLLSLVNSKVTANEDNYLNNLYRGEDDDASNNTFEEDLELIKDDINTVGLNVENLAFDLFTQLMKFFNSGRDKDEQKKVRDSPVLVSQINLSEIRQIEDSNGKLPINTIMKKIDSFEKLSPKNSENHTIKIRSADAPWENLPIFSKEYQKHLSVLNPEDNRTKSRTSLFKNQKNKVHSSKKASNPFSLIMKALQPEEFERDSYQETNDSEANMSQNNSNEYNKIEDMNEKIFEYLRFLEDVLKNLHKRNSDEIIENIRDEIANLFKKVPSSSGNKLKEAFEQIQKNLLSRILREYKKAETVEIYNNNEHQHDMLDEVKHLLFSFLEEALKKSLAITKPAHKENNIDTSNIDSISNTIVKEEPEESLKADSVRNIFHSFENNYVRQKRQVDSNKNLRNSNSNTRSDERNFTTTTESVTISEGIHSDGTNRSEIRANHSEITDPSHDAEKKCFLQKDGKHIDESLTEVLQKECPKLYSIPGEPIQVYENEITNIRHDDQTRNNLAEKFERSNTSTDRNIATESSNLGKLIMKDFGSIKQQIESAERALNETRKFLEEEKFKEDHLQVQMNNQKIEMRLLKSMLQVLLEKYFKGPNDQGHYSKTVSQNPAETYDINKNSVSKLKSVESHSLSPIKSKIKSVQNDSNDINTLKNLELRTSLRNTNGDKKYNSDDKDVLEELVAFSKRFGDERERKDLDEQFDKIKLKISQLRDQEMNENNNKFNVGQLSKSLGNVPQPASKSNEDILDELNHLQNAIDKLKPKDNNRFEHENESLKMFLEKLINTNQANREIPNENIVHGFHPELYKRGYFQTSYPAGYEALNSNIDDNQYLCTVNISPANKLWMTHNNVNPNCLEKPFQSTESKFENAKPYQRNVVSSTQHFRENNVPTDRTKGSSSSRGYLVNSNSEVNSNSNFDFSSGRIKNDPTILPNKIFVPSDKPKITELPSTNTYAIGNSNAVPSPPMKKYDETPALTDKYRIQHSTGIRYIPETNFREEIVKLKEETKNLQSAIDTLNLLGTQDAVTLHNLRVEINDLNRMINSLEENDPYIIRQESANLSPQNPPSWPTSLMNQSKQIRKREVPLSNEPFPMGANPDGQQRARGALGDNIQDIKNKVKELKSKLDPTTEQSGDPIARSSSSDDGHLYPLQYSPNNPIPATYLLDPKSATGIKDDWFVGVVSKIMDKVILALPIIFKKLMEFLFGQFTGLAYNDGYGNGYSTDVQNIINDLGIFGVLPLIALKVLQGLSSIINILRKNKFLKNFLIPAIIIGVVASSLIFLIWWLQPDDASYVNNAISDISNYANSNSENNYGAANSDYVNNHGEYKMYRNNDDKNDFSPYNSTLFKTLTNS